MTTVFHPHKRTVQTVGQTILTVKLYYYTCFFMQTTEENVEMGIICLQLVNSITFFTEFVFTLIDSILDCNIFLYEHSYKLEDHVSTGNGILTKGI